MVSITLNCVLEVRSYLLLIKRENKICGETNQKPYQDLDDTTIISTFSTFE